MIFDTQDDFIKVRLLMLTASFTQIYGSIFYAIAILITAYSTYMCTICDPTDEVSIAEK